MPLPDTLAAPAVYVTTHPNPTPTERTRVRVIVSDDGSLTRCHLVIRLAAGDVDVALGPEAVADLAAALAAADARIAATFAPEAVA